jgi:hypothetical protein
MQWMPLKRRQLSNGYGKTTNGKSENHNGDGRSHPGKKRALVRQMVPRSIGIEFFRHVPCRSALFHSIGVAVIETFSPIDVTSYVSAKRVARSR